MQIVEKIAPLIEFSDDKDFMNKTYLDTNLKPLTENLLATKCLLSFLEKQKRSDNLFENAVKATIQTLAMKVYWIILIMVRYWKNA